MMNGEGGAFIDDVVTNVTIRASGSNIRPIAYYLDRT
jgi:hypothetical protein